MTNINFRDPAISISVGIILIGLALLIWAIGRLRQKSSEPPLDDLGLTGASDAPPKDSLFDTGSSASSVEVISPPVEPERRPEPERRSDFEPRSREPAAPEPATPPISKEMVDRLDGMSQRLTEMQTVLQRQVNNPAGTALSAETLDKLLKIIGNVTLQVDILQRSLGATPSASPKPLETISAAAAVANPPPAAQPATDPATTPAPSSSPAASPKPTGPGGRAIGVSGGALSSFPRPAAKPGTGPGSTSPPSNSPGK